MIKWPAELPAPQFGIVFRPRDPQLRTDMQNGRTMARRNFTAVPEDFSARWILTDEQAVRYEQFYQQDTKDGTLWFDMPLLLAQGEVERTVRFTGVYTHKRLGCNVWEYECEMELYLRAKA